MDELIMKLDKVRYAIQNLEGFVPTEHNCNQILGSIQQLKYVTERLRMMDAGKDKGFGKGGADGQNQDGNKHKN